MEISNVATTLLGPNLWTQKPDHAEWAVIVTAWIKIMLLRIV